MTGKPHKILVVDDLADWRNTLNGLLADEGYAVRVAGSSDEALQLFGRDQFDLALIDVRLDETDDNNTEGLSLAREIRKRWPNTKVVIITGYGTQSIVERAMRPTQGHKLAENYIQKDGIYELAGIVREVLAVQR
jgi:CheY-like chemotaxis protein